MGVISCFVNGRPEAGLSSYDRGISYGHGLFETMRLWQGTLPLFDWHLKRLTADSKILSLHYDPEEIVAQVEGALAAFPPDGVVKLILTAGAAVRGYRYPRGSKVSCVVQYFELSPSPAAKTLQLCNYRLPHNPYLAGIKHLNRLDQVIAATELLPGSDGLLLDQTDIVIEALSSNIFLLAGSHWLTPSLFKSGVSGVMRTLLIEDIFVGMGTTVSIADIDINMLADASEVFTCNAVSGITTITEVPGIASWATSQASEIIRDRLTERYPCFGE